MLRHPSTEYRDRNTGRDFVFGDTAYPRAGKSNRGNPLLERGRRRLNAGQGFLRGRFFCVIQGRLHVGAAFTSQTIENFVSGDLPDEQEKRRRHWRAFLQPTV
jgi:hypothetical protein